MIGSRKAILVVDDSEIDRIILKNILSDDFEVLEAENGKAALSMILDKMDCLDTILLDVSMPIMDGFSVLEFMKNKKIGNIPVFLVTAEATRDNVERAAHYSVSEFIGKPFHREEILKRLKVKLGVPDVQEITEKEMEETDSYICALKSVYDRYLDNFGIDKGRYSRVSHMMRMLLEREAADTGYRTLDPDRIDIISRAAYFYDIGMMLVPPEYQNIMEDELNVRAEKVYRSHTICGAELVSLNSFGHCRFFVRECTDMCSHHHERYDGGGFPHRLREEHFTLQAQLCGLLDSFDRQFGHYRKHNDLQADFCIRTILQDTGAYSEEAFALLKGARDDIVAYYRDYCL